MSNAYDETQYESYAYSQTHPEHLYTLARLFGLAPKHFKGARILELGAASGGNIIPMASHLPDSQFLGIDLSKKQVEEGQAFIQNLKLSNIELRQQSILDFTPDEGMYDYIICHGIYSWVPEEVQNKILSIFKQNLAPQGVAFLSYNTLPGWSMVKSMREMMLYHTADISDPEQKATQARALLHFISEGLEGEKTSYAEFLKMEIELLKKQPNSYLLHDHLEAVNLPIYFYELIERAASENLSYLSDAQLTSMFVGNLPAQFSQEIGKVKNIVVANQYMDFIRNQRFRQTLFCHDQVQIQRNLDTQVVEKFSFTFLGKVEPKISEVTLAQGVEMKFIAPSITMTTQNKLSKQILAMIARTTKPLSYHDLIKNIAKHDGFSQDQIRHHINHEINLLRLILGGLVGIHSSEGDYISKINEYPKTSAHAIAQAKIKAYAVNKRHEMVSLNPLERVLIQRLDGKTSQTELVGCLLQDIKGGVFSLIDENKRPLTDEAALKTRLQDMVTQTLAKFSQCALIME